MATFAVIATGGKQYRVMEGETIEIEKLKGKVGETLTFAEVLMVGATGSDDVKIGAPTVAGATVLAEVVEQGLGEKVTGMKYKRKVRYRHRMGHRQQQTWVKITKIA
jgi:large subunit ribosomal protein L21